MDGLGKFLESLLSDSVELRAIRIIHSSGWPKDVFIGKSIRECDSPDIALFRFKNGKMRQITNGHLDFWELIHDGFTVRDDPSSDSFDTH